MGKRGGAAGIDSDTLVYRLALSVTAFQLGVDRARHALVHAGLDGRASVQDLHRAIGLALAALDEAEANRLTELTSADLRGIAVPVDASPEEGHPDAGR